MLQVYSLSAMGYRHIVDNAKNNRPCLLEWIPITFTNVMENATSMDKGSHEVHSKIILLTEDPPPAFKSTKTMRYYKAGR